MEEIKARRIGATVGTINHIDKLHSYLNGEKENLYTQCPEEFSHFIKKINLQDFVYWKLQEEFTHLNFENKNNLLNEILSKVEHPLFTLVLQAMKGNQCRAAKILGCNRNTLHRKLKEAAINAKEAKYVPPKNSRRGGKLKDPQPLPQTQTSSELEL